MENHILLWENSLLMAIFNSYVKLPEGTVLGMIFKIIPSHPFIFLTPPFFVGPKYISQYVVSSPKKHHGFWVFKIRRCSKVGLSHLRLRPFPAVRKPELILPLMTPISLESSSILEHVEGLGFSFNSI